MPPTALQWVAMMVTPARPFWQLEESFQFPFFPQSNGHSRHPEPTPGGGGGHSCRSGVLSCRWGWRHPRLLGGTQQHPTGRIPQNTSRPAGPQVPRAPPLSPIPPHPQTCLSPPLPPAPPHRPAHHSPPCCAPPRRIAGCPPRSLTLHQPHSLHGCSRGGSTRDLNLPPLT